MGQSNKVYVVDKTENNPVRINGHPAWATEYDLATNTYRTMDIVTNSFCAGGNVLGNGMHLFSFVVSRSRPLNHFSRYRNLDKCRR